MKRVLTASILGLAASVVSSYGQAQYYFDTYLAAGATPDAGVVEFSPGAPVANGLYTATLSWHDLGNSLSGVVGAGSPVVDGYVSGGQFSFDPTWNGSQLQFTINVVGPAGATGSLSWTEPTQTPSGFESFQAMPQLPITMTSSVPEPGTLALAGLGVAALLFRKRQ